MWNPSMIPIKALMVACLVLMLLQAFSLRLQAHRDPPRSAIFHEL